MSQKETVPRDDDYFRAVASMRRRDRRSRREERSRTTERGGESTERTRERNDR